VPPYLGCQAWYEEFFTWPGETSEQNRNNVSAEDAPLKGKAPLH
jgi:hypothetical protein